MSRRLELWSASGKNAPNTATRQRPVRGRDSAVVGLCAADAGGISIAEMIAAGGKVISSADMIAAGARG